MAASVLTAGHVSFTRLGAAVYLLSLGQSKCVIESLQGLTETGPGLSWGASHPPAFIHIGHGYESWLLAQYYKPIPM